MYEFSNSYDWIIFLDADCLINPNGKDLTKLVDDDVVLIAKHNLHHHFFQITLRVSIIFNIMHHFLFSFP